MPNNLYFVDSIFRSNGEVDGDNYVNLISTDRSEDGYFPTFYVKVTKRQLILVDNDREIEEGEYVIYVSNGEDDHRFSDGNQEQYAQEQIRTGKEIREALASPEQESSNVKLSAAEVKVLIEAEEVCSYHVNVGHGNCSLIFVKSKDDYLLWMVDCSIIERGNKASKWQNHQSSLKACMNDISGKIRRPQPHIDRLFLTHMHYDHYSGVEYLMQKGYIDETTVYYINHYYECNSETIVTFLKTMKAKNAIIIEPISANSLNADVRILHPEKRIYKKGTSKGNPNSREVSKANNASVVYRFVISDRTMLFPGDLEKEGFDNMTQFGLCSPWLHYSNFYVISHHGSLNGHPETKCLGTGVFGTDLECISTGLSKAVLLGRDGAYSTMFDPHVVSDFDYNKKLITTDMKSGKTPLKYLTLNWMNGNVQYYY
jgi:hypothetical protein